LIAGILLFFLILLANVNAQEDLNSSREWRIEFNKDLSVKQDFKVEGVLPEEVIGWGKDCSKKLMEKIDAKALVLQNNIVKLKADPNLDENEVKELSEVIYSAVNALIRMKSTISCTLLKEEGGKGVLNYSFVLDKGVIDSLKRAKEDERNFSISRDNGKIRVSFKAIEDNELIESKTKKLTIKVEGELIELKREDYKQVGAEFVFPDFDSVENSTVKLVYGIEEDGKKEEEGSLFGGLDSIFSGITASSILLYGAIGFVFLVIVIAVIILVKKIKKKKEKEEEEEELTDKEKLEKKVLDRGKGKSAAYMEEVEEKPGKREKKGNGKEEVEKLYDILKEHKDEFDYEQVKKAVLIQGYSEGVAENVAKKIYPKEG